MSQHDDEPIGTSGIQEDHNPVPLWLKLVVAGLLVFFVAYLVQYLTGVQPSTAH